MLEVFINYICALMMAFAGYYIIKIIIKYDEQISYKTILILIINSIIILSMHYIEFNVFTSLYNFIINTITYKIVFNKKYSAAFTYTAILMIIIFISELIWMLILVNFTTMDILRENIYFYLLTNILIIITSLSVMKIKISKKVLSKFYNILTKKEKIINIIFLLLFVLCISSLMYNLTMNFHRNIFFLSNSLITLGTILIVMIYMRNNEEFNKLESEYNSLLINVKNFEEWIEKEQYMRHEYKNQLAIIYALTKEQKVKNKIQEIINQNLSIESEVVNSLKSLPKGSLKGIIYYRSIVAQNNKIKLTIDVSIKSKGIFSKIDENKMNSIAKLIGIYYDNAIEAAKESRKKIILLEIYEFKNKVSIVLSNTFKKNSIIRNNNEKGISTKGEGRGNGLYFAKKILAKNSWIEEKQEIIDNYYIETIIIKKDTSE